MQKYGEEVHDLKFDKDKRSAIKKYILEKIDQNVPNLSAHVSEALGVNQSTVYRYLNELLKANEIEKPEHGRYCLTRHQWNYVLSRKDKELDSDMYGYSKCLAEHLSAFSDNIKNIWAYVFSEMINNVIDHSEAEHAYVTVEQDIFHTTVILRDDGIGIFEKIRGYFGYDTIEDAIIELFKGKLTTDSRNHSGEGIFFSSRMMDKFYIVSSGHIFSCNVFDEDSIFRIADGKSPGTTVIMALSNTSVKTSSDIFDQYADVDGGFTKTMIPLKNIFDAPPVSRSQAKRLCNRLDCFKEVVLDFNGLEWMGQGFTHQIFQIFAKDHPQILLKPINMTEKVEKMYRHVMAESRQ